jgi:hypothetical protein
MTNEMPRSRRLDQRRQAGFAEVEGPAGDRRRDYRTVVLPLDRDVEARLRE